MMRLSFPLLKGRQDMAMNRSERFEPAILEAFERELTSDVMRRMLEFAARRTAMMRAAGIAVASDEAKRLVEDAIAETLGRLASWQVGVVPLWRHLRAVVRRRSWARIADTDKPALQGPITSQPDPAHALAEISGDDDPRATARARELGAYRLIRELFDGLDQRREEDAAVGLLLKAYCRGATTRAEVVDQSGLSEQASIQARRRLDQMLAERPSAMRESAVHELWRSP
jgi:hypothetical protein